MKLAHIINPVKANKSSDLYFSQPVTFKTMLKAKAYSKYSENIELYVVGYDEDIPIYPKEFKQLPSLQKSILDVHDFNKKRKLPLIKDILKALNEIDADYVIYTNVDIAILPFFYDYIIAKIKAGSDSLIINRRVIPNLKEDVLMYGELGDSHPGYDCFVFKKSILSSFELYNTCIGANWIGRAMYANLLVFSDAIEIVKKAHLTFHIGEDGAWLIHDFSEFDIFNKKEVYKVISKLLTLTDDQDKIEELHKVLRFMDNWGKQPIKENPGIIKRVRQCLKKIIKALIHSL